MSHVCHQLLLGWLEAWRVELQPPGPAFSINNLFCTLVTKAFGTSDHLIELEAWVHTVCLKKPTHNDALLRAAAASDPALRAQAEQAGACSLKHPCTLGCGITVQLLVLCAYTLETQHWDGLAAVCVFYTSHGCGTFKLQHLADGLQLCSYQWEITKCMLILHCSPVPVCRGDLYLLTFTKVISCPQDICTSVDSYYVYCNHPLSLSKSCWVIEVPVYTLKTTGVAMLQHAGDRLLQACKLGDCLGQSSEVLANCGFIMLQPPEGSFSCPAGFLRFRSLQLPPLGRWCAHSM